MSRIRDFVHRPVFLLFVVLTCSAFFHLWNPIGYPHLLDDEGIYTGAGVRLSEGSGPQDPEIGYLWPYFGEIFLASIFSIIGYPTSMIHYNQLDILLSVEILWLVPRVIMGILAVIDTFLVYKIAETRYNRKVALISAILFAIMPFSLFTRWILLDSILLPFLLLSIFLAMSKKYPSYIDNNQNFKYILTILLSGISLGIAIFTKIPVFTMVPLIGFFIFRNSSNSFKILSAWLIPVVLIPLVWPAYAFSAGELNLWLEGIYYQTHREYAPLIFSFINIFTLDPILIALGIAGLILAIIKKDVFLLLWILPFVFFLQLIGYVSFFHLTPIFPALCIGGARFIENLFKKFMGHKLFGRTLPFVIISAIGIYAIMSATSAFTFNVNETNFKATAFITRYLSDHNNITVIANPFYLWVPKQVFHLEDNVHYPNYSDIPSIKTEKVLFVLDDDIKKDLGYSVINSSAYDVAGVKNIASYDPVSNETDVIRELNLFHSAAPKIIDLLFDLNDNMKKTLGHSVINSSAYVGVKVPLTRIGAYDVAGVKNIASFVDSLYNESSIVIILRDLDPYHSTAPRILSLIDQNHTWKPAIAANVSQNHMGLHIVVNTSDMNKLFSRAFLQTEIDKRERPLLLSLNFSAKSVKGTAIFQPEIRDSNGSKIIWGGQTLDNTGRQRNETFVLPDDIVNKQIEFRLNIITQGPGVHYFTINNITLG